MKSVKIVRSIHHEMRLDRALTTTFANVPKSLFYKLLRKRKISIRNSNDKLEKIKNPAFRIDCSNHKEILIPASALLNLKSHSKKKLDESDVEFVRKLVIFKNEKIIALKKPCELATQGGEKVKISVDDLCEGLRFNSNQRPKLVHRLDKATSGVLLLARDIQTARILGKMFSSTDNSSKQIEKSYLAMVFGAPKPSNGIIDNYVARRSFDNGGESMFVVDEPKSEDVHNFQRAVTQYKTLQTVGTGANTYSMLHLKPLTGRQHQLRLHCHQSLGCSIVGDKKYYHSTFAASTNSSLLLHAVQLKLPMSLFSSKSVPPQYADTARVERDQLVLSAPLPRKFKGVFKQRLFDESILKF